MSIRSIADPRDRRAAVVAAAQHATYTEDVDYVHGSPHLSHAALRSWLIGRLGRLVGEAFDRVGRCRVLEVGGGHGKLTAELAATGASVTVTEMSGASARVMRERFRHNPQVSVLHDPTGEAVFALDGQFEIVLCISVLHHIPDYLGFVGALVEMVSPGGAFASYQDPDWYPRRATLDAAADRGAYFAWRLAQGDLIAGARTRVRRLQGRYDTDLSADMTEYHVVRRGVNERVLLRHLLRDFVWLEEHRYWSTQSGVLQRAGERLDCRNTFAIEATARRALPGVDPA